MVITGFTRIWNISFVYWLKIVNKFLTGGRFDIVKEAGAAIREPLALGDG